MTAAVLDHGRHGVDGGRDRVVGTGQHRRVRLWLSALPGPDTSRPPGRQAARRRHVAAAVLMAAVACVLTS